LIIHPDTAGTTGVPLRFGCRLITQDLMDPLRDRRGIRYSHDLARDSKVREWVPLNVVDLFW